jgi:phosphate-selective porin OprO/OprP
MLALITLWLVTLAQAGVAPETRPPAAPPRDPASAPPAAAPDESDEKKASPGVGTESTPSERMDRLEKEIRELRAAEAARRAGLPAGLSLGPQGSPASKTGDVDFKISFTDGFHLKSTDGDFDLHIGGRVEEVYRDIFDRPILGGAATKLQPNTFYFHELFLSADGTLYRDWGFKINGDFSPQGANATNGSTSANSGAIPEQAWVEWKHFNECRIQFGQFKSPNEAESIESPLFQELVNRSPMSRFVENWELGMQIYGSLMEGLFTYQIALMNGRGHLSNAGKSLVDDNDGKELDARVTLAPWVADKQSFLKGLRAGLWGSDAREGQGSRFGLNATGFPPANTGFQSTDFAVSYLVFNTPNTFVFHGARVREGAELTYAAGPFEFRGELMERRDEFFITSGPFNGADRMLGMRGYYGQVSCILTGEEKIPDARIIPLHALDPANGHWGAIELAARVGGVSFDRARLNEMFAPTTPIAAGNANRMDALAVGFNWWFTQNTKLAFDYVAEHYYDSVVLGVESRKHLNGFLAQAQVDF